MSKRPELTAAERALPYAKFYDLPITPITKKKIPFQAHAPNKPDKAVM